MNIIGTVKGMRAACPWLKLRDAVQYERLYGFMRNRSEKSDYYKVEGLNARLFKEICEKRSDPIRVV